MRQKFEIGVLGAPINNMNLGCQALTYSLIILLEQISVKHNVQFHYYIFEGNPNRRLDDIFCKRLQIAPSKLESVNYGNHHDVLRKIKYWKQNENVKIVISKCDLIIDLTEGDSFTDIYGNERFINLTTIKEIVEDNTSLLLGSQTYGPFHNIKNEKRAAKVIQKASAVFTRDQISKDYIKRISNVDPILTCDIAFCLPYKHQNKSNIRIPHRIGFNISGLLVSNRIENTPTESKKTVYDEFVDRVLRYLILKSYEVHLIGHVIADYPINNIMKEKYPSVILAPEFDNPMDAKSYISSMDLFIGSRMHATIAALTSNTPVVPVAYSRKFAGVFEGIQYPYIVDLQKEDTDHAVQDIINRIENYDDTKSATEKSYLIAMKEKIECLHVYDKVISELLKKPEK